MTDLDKTLQSLNAPVSVTLKRYELRTLANLADAQADRHHKKASRKNASQTLQLSETRAAKSYEEIAQALRIAAADPDRPIEGIVARGSRPDWDAIAPPKPTPSA